MSDVIDTLVGIAPGSKLDAIRAQRSEARMHAQASYTSLFEPRDMGSVTAEERVSVASFVAGLHGEPQTDAFYSSKLPAGLRKAVAAEVAAAKTKGPYGHKTKGPHGHKTKGPHGPKTKGPGLGRSLRTQRSGSNQ